MSEHTSGNAGGEARRKYQQTKKKLENRRKARSHLQQLLAKLFGVDSTLKRKAITWDKAASGEVGIGKELDGLAKNHRFFVLHDRKIPKSLANIDHLCATPSGVFVIDAKNYSGRVRIQEGDLLDIGSKPSLYVGSRKQTKLVEGVKHQVEIVRGALRSEGLDLPVYVVLAFYDAEFPIFFNPAEVDGVLINGKGLEQAIIQKLGGSVVDLEKLGQLLKRAFPPKKRIRAQTLSVGCR